MDLTKAHALAREIRESAEFKRFIRAKEAVSGDPDSVGLLKEYKRLELSCRAAALSGGEDRESAEKLRRLAGYLQMNEDTAEYIDAELCLSCVIGDIYSILMEASGLDFSLFEG